MVKSCWVENSLFEFYLRMEHRKFIPVPPAKVEWDFSQEYLKSLETSFQQFNPVNNHVQSKNHIRNIVENVCSC